MTIKTRFNAKNHKIYNPKNVNKYRGTYPIIMRSSWETAFARWCDMNPLVISWSSENIAIPYKHPFKTTTKGLPKTARYYPDFLIEVKTEIGLIKWLIEIKPYKETKQPMLNGSKKRKTMIYEQKTWKINKAKWIAAERYCKKFGWTFKIITEKELLR